MKEKIELREKRGPREKHFLLENGTMEAELYEENVHYLKNGVYEEIDNKFLSMKEEFSNQKHAFLVFLPKKNRKKTTPKNRTRKFLFDTNGSTSKNSKTNLSRNPTSLS